MSQNGACSGNLPSDPNYVWHRCPPSAEGAYLPKSTTKPNPLCCSTGQNLNNTAENCYPVCKPAGTTDSAASDNNQLFMCPGADLTRFIAQSNDRTKEAGNTVYMYKGMCVDKTNGLGVAKIEPSCSAPTECVLRGSSSAMEDPPHKWYNCTANDAGNNVDCLKDEFVCDRDLALCRHTSVQDKIKNKGPGAPTTYADCQAACIAQYKFACTDGQCKQDPNGTYDSYMDCISSGPCAETAKYKCDPASGCIQDPAGTYTSKDQCNSACQSRCNDQYQCVMSDDTKLTGYKDAITCAQSCVAPAATGGGGMSTEAVWGLVVGICAFVLIVLIVIWWWRRRRLQAAAQA